MSNPLPTTSAAREDRGQSLQDVVEDVGVMSSSPLIPAPEDVELASTSNTGDDEGKGSVENPIEEEATSSLSVFEILPEIWRSNIIPYLQPAGFESVINSSPMWRSWFKSERTEMLLPLVLPIVLKNCGMSKPTELLCWRGVNKSAKSIVENLLEESSSPQNYQEPDRINSPLWTPVWRNTEEDLRLVIQKVKSHYQFYRVRRLKQFVDLTNSAPGVPLANPFLTKSLVVGEVGSSVVGNRANVLQKQLIMSLVQRYGHLIQSFSYVWRSDVPFLFSILSQLPNLKVLEVEGDSTPLSEDDIGRWLPLVRLNQLLVLNVTYVNEVKEFPMLPPLLSCVGPQLETLVCSSKAFDHETLRRGDFPNIQSLRVNYANLPFLHRLSDLGFPLPLRQLELHHWFKNIQSEAPTFADNNRIVGAFASTLTHLKLYMPVRENDNGEHVDNLVVFSNLSNLTIDWEDLRERWFPNFIRLQVPHLAELNLIQVDPQANRNEVVEIRGMIQDLQIFENVPTLQRINILGGFQMFDDEDDEQDAEKVVIKRSGTARTFLYKKIDEDQSIYE